MELNEKIVCCEKIARDLEKVQKKIADEELKLKLTNKIPERLKATIVREKFLPERREDSARFALKKKSHSSSKLRTASKLKKYSNFNESERNFERKKTALDSIIEECSSLRKNENELKLKLLKKTIDGFYRSRQTLNKQNEQEVCISPNSIAKTAEEQEKISRYLTRRLHKNKLEKSRPKFLPKKIEL